MVKKIKEEFWKIEAQDNKSIYGVKNFQDGNDSAVICVHGLTRDMHEHILKMLASTFPSQGIDVIRYNLYGNEKGARKLNNTGLFQYSSDLITVFNNFAQEYSTIYIVGHSFGAIIALTAQIEGVTSYSLWDPSYNTAEWPRHAQKHGDAISIEVFGREYIYSSQLINDFSKCDDEFCKALAQKNHGPIQVIFAGNGDLVRQNASYHTHARESKKDVIDGSTHLFPEQHCSHELCRLTENWFKSLSI